MADRTKAQKLEAAKVAYMQAGADGLTDKQLAEAIGVPERAAARYRVDLGCRKIGSYSYTYVPTADELEFARLVMIKTQG